MKDQNLVVIGRITGKHGIRGAVKLYPLTDYPDRFLEMDKLDLYGNSDHLRLSLTVSRIRFIPDKGYFLVESEEILTPEDASTLKGLLVKIPSDQRVTLDEGEIWIEDLIGLKVIASEGKEEIGILEEVVPGGENDLYLVRDTSGNVRYIPAVGEFIKNIDLENGYIEVSLIEGL